MAHLHHSPCNWSDFKGFFWSFPISLNLDKRFPGIITRLIIPKINILGFSVLLCLGVLSRSRLYWLIPPKWFPHYPSFCQILLPPFSSSSALARGRKVFCWAHKWSIIVREVEMRGNFSTKSWQKSGKRKTPHIIVGNIQSWFLWWGEKHCIELLGNWRFIEGRAIRGFAGP